MLRTVSETGPGAAQALGYWDEWHARCALGRCDEPAQQALRRFSGRRFAGFLERYRRNCPGRGMPPAPSDADAWHLLETYMTVPGARSGKRYKDWLFTRARGEGPERLDALQAGAGLLIRSTVRRFISQEASRQHHVSLEAPLDRVGRGNLTLSDLLPDHDTPADATHTGDLHALSERHARSFAAEIDPRIRVALKAKYEQRSLAHPDVTTAAGCGKSVLRENYRNFLMDLFAHLQAKHPNEDRQVLVDLAVRVVDRLQGLMHEAHGGASEHAASCPKPATAALFRG